MKVRLAVFSMWLGLFLIAVVRRQGPESESIGADRKPKAVMVSPAPEEEYENLATGAPELPAVDTDDKVESGGLGPRIVRCWREDALARIARMQNADGSWGGGLESLGDHRVDPTGLTSLALLGFLSCGYSHLSRDEYDGVPFGTAVKSGLKWLISVQADDGTFGTGGDADLNQILASLALSEAYGMSATRIFKEPAQRAIDALSTRFSRRPSWDGDSVAAWAALAISSARFSELEVAESFVWLNRYFLSVGANSEDRPAATAGWALLQDQRFVSTLQPIAEQWVRSVPMPADLERVFFESIVIQRGIDPRTPEADRERWAAIAALCKEASLQENEPSPGDIVRISLWLASLGAKWWP
jgi:hypothetical protein